MDVSKNRGTPKWMMKIMENPIKMDDLGGKTTPIFGSTPIFGASWVQDLTGPKKKTNRLTERENLRDFLYGLVRSSQILPSL